MRIMVCRDNGTLDHAQEIEAGQAVIILTSKTSPHGEFWVVKDATCVSVGDHVRLRLDLGERLMVGLAVALQFVWMTHLAAQEAAVLLVPAAVWAWLLRKAWRATA